MGNKLGYPEVDLSGKVALVTGGNTGVGYETAKGLARLGAHTFVACRSKERAESAIERMKTELSQMQKQDPAVARTTANEENSGGANDPGEDKEVRSKDSGNQASKEVKVEYIPLDLASFQSTKECVRIFKERNLPLHILINNAAVAGPKYTRTEDNLEIQLQVNHLGPVLFTLELLPILLDTAASSGDVRIMFVSSSGHTMAEPFDVEQLDKSDDQYKRFKNYCNTKLYNVMSGYCLQRRLQNKSITVSSLHPGYVRTELVRNFTDRTIWHSLHKVAVNVVGLNPKEGAVTSLNCAVNPELNSQQHFYYDNCKTKVSSVESRNEEFQEQMWKKTFEFLKDHLSPDIYQQYGPKTVEEPTQLATEVVAEKTAGDKGEQNGEDKQEILAEDKVQPLETNQPASKGDEEPQAKDKPIVKENEEEPHEDKEQPQASEEQPLANEELPAQGN